MMRCFSKLGLVGAIALFPVVAAPCARAFTLVDIISDSDEFAQNSEPSIAVNPANPAQVFVTAFNDFDNASFEPQPSFVFFSGNGGAAWSVYQRFDTLDVSVAWADGGRPYLAHLFPPNNFSAPIMLVRAADLPVANAQFNILPAGTYAAGDVADQPWVVASRAGGQDRVYITFNDFNTFPRTAGIQFSLDGGATWKRETLERRSPGLQDGPPVRTAVAGDTVYVAFERWDDFFQTDFFSGVGVGELVIMKDTDAGRGHFRALGAAGAGRIVQGGLQFPFGSGNLGQERTGSGLSIAVDPRDARVVFIAVEVSDVGPQRVAVFCTTDGGRNWTRCYDLRPGTGLPALAISASGVVGLEYTGAFHGLLETHLLQTTDRFATVGDTTLSRFTDTSLVPSFDPFVGDFQRLVAVGNVFHGTFSASNDTTLYPQQPVFVRDRSRLGGRVPHSIDPFYFNIDAITVAPPVTTPIAREDRAVFQSEFGVEIDVLANDTEPGGDTLSVSKVGEAAAGFATLLRSGRIAYQPSRRRFAGSDSFTYTVSNGVGETAEATVNVSNPFFAVRGAFTGLSFGANASTTGLLNGNLSDSGIFSAKLRLGADTFALLGKFDLNGDFVSVIQRPGRSTLTVQLHLDFVTGAFTGSIGDGTFTTPIDAGLSSFSRDNPAPQAGAYTFVLRRDPADSEGASFRGGGFGNVLVKSRGAIRAVGTLPDTVPFSFGGQLDNTGRWFLAATISGAASAPDSLTGLVTFADLPGSDFAGAPIRWVRAPHFAVPPFGDPFTANLTMIGSRYAVPAAGKRVFLESRNGLGVAHLQRGSGSDFALDFTLGTQNRATFDPPATRGFQIDPRTGLLTGRAFAPGALRPGKLAGAVLQKSDSAFGYFLNDGATGPASFGARQ